MSVRSEWCHKFLPLRRVEEADYGLPYFMALKAVELGEGTDEHLAELAGHLMIAKHLTRCNQEVIRAGEEAVKGLIKEWEHYNTFDPMKISLVVEAICHYHEVARVTSRRTLSKAIDAALSDC